MLKHWIADHPTRTDSFSESAHIKLFENYPGAISRIRVAAWKVAFGQAQQIILSMPGYVSHQLQKCIERPDRYVLLVNWQSLEDRTIGFRESEQNQEWRRLFERYE